MAEPKAYEPEKLTSGVTWKWKKTLSDYPASEWTLTYYFRKSGATATSFSASADGDTHLVTVTAATTAGYAAGVYDIIGVVVKSAEKYVVFDGILEVLTNPATASARDAALERIMPGARRVRMMECHTVSDLPTTGERQAVRDSIETCLAGAALLELRGHLGALGPPPVTLIGTGGMASLFVKMELADDGYDRDRMEAVQLPLAQVTALRERLWDLPLAKRRTIIGLPSNRADVALFGSLIYEQLMRELGFAALRISTRGLRFGALQS